MTVLGLGVDLVDVERMARAIARRRFVERVFDPLERPVGVARPAEWYAARFAAKEACLKALGLGLARGRLAAVVVVRDPSGRPHLHLKGEPAARLKALGATRAHVSLSHERGMAVAVVVVD